MDISLEHPIDPTPPLPTTTTLEPTVQTQTQPTTTQTTEESATLKATSMSLIEEAPIQRAATAPTPSTTTTTVTETTSKTAETTQLDTTDKENKETERSQSPIIQVHSGPPPKRNVAVKATSSAAFSRPGSSSVPNSFARISNDSKKNLASESDDDEYLPPETTRRQSAAAESDADSNMSNDSGALKRKLPLRTIKKAKINDDTESINSTPQNSESQKSTTSIAINTSAARSTARKSTAPSIRTVQQQQQQQQQQQTLNRPSSEQTNLKHTKGCQSRPKCETKATQSRPVMCDQSTQLDNTNEEELMKTGAVSRLQIVPVPVPIHVPLPMCMYQAPLPVPILVPVPIPVPVIIPTTKKTYDRIHRKIRKLRKKLPSDPNEFELLLYAEKLAREEGIAGFEESSDGESEPETYQRKSRRGDQHEHNNKTTTALDNITEQFIDQDNTMSAQLQQQLEQQQIMEQQQQNQTESTSLFKWHVGMKIFNQWLLAKSPAASQTTMTNGGANHNPDRLPTDILKLTNGELNTVLAEFVQEVRKPDGETYAPESIYYICLGVQHYLEESKRVENIFLDASLFDRFQAAFDEVAARRYKIRLDEHGLVTCRIEEEILWETRQLGAHSPLVLLYTLMYFNTKCFFLEKREQHKKLSFANVRKHVKKNVGPNGEDFGRTSYLRYYPEVHGHEQIIYEQCENYENPLRCPVELYNFYLSKCPESVKSRSDVFYLMPEKASLPTSPIWFSSQPVNDAMLDRMLNRIKMVKEVNDWLMATTPIQ